MIFTALANAFRSIWTKKTRSLLTMLGVIIGVAQIIALIGLGNGVKKSVSDQVTQLGTNVIFLLPGKLQDSNGGFNPSASVGASTITESDLTFLKQQPEIEQLSPISLLAGTPVAGDTQASGVMTVAVEPPFFSIVTTLHLEAGRLLAAEDGATKAKVLVMGQKVSTQLFPGVANAQVVGKTVTIGKNTFTIVGVVNDKQSNSPFGSDSYGSMTFMPYQTGRAVNENAQIFRIVMKLDPNVNAKAFAQSLTQKFVARHGVEDVTVFSQEDLLKVVDNILSLITTAIVGLASISLIVGGIGIMNIMLVAVSERTKEIGLRKALGATRASILIQFLTESAIISLLGGAIGVGLVSVASIIVKQKANLEIIVDWHSILIATSFSLGVGLLFGLLPAFRAARKDPIDALRYE